MGRSSRNTVTVVVEDIDPREPASLCDRCGAQGTVARAVRHSEPPLALRYCSACWPAAWEELEKRKSAEQDEWQEAWFAWSEGSARDPEGASPCPDPPPAWTGASRSWFDGSHFLALIAGPMNGGPAATPAQLAEIAAEIRRLAPEMDGPIPPDVEAFLATHLPPSE